MPNKRAKAPLERAFHNERRDIVKQDIVGCANGLAFDIVLSPYWQKLASSINEAPKVFKGPGHEKVCTNLLEKEAKHVNDGSKQVSIISDGWKDARNRSLINLIAMSTRDAMFLRAVDCEGQVKDSPFIANIPFQAIEQVGTLNFVQIANSSSSERNWSTYSIHSIKCNRLQSKKGEDLVYVHSKLRLLTHKEHTYKKGETKQWNVEPELVELDDTVARLDALGVDDMVVYFGVSLCYLD